MVLSRFSFRAASSRPSKLGPVLCLSLLCNSKQLRSSALVDPRSSFRLMLFRATSPSHVFRGTWDNLISFTASKYPSACLSLCSRRPVPRNSVCLRTHTHTHTHAHTHTHTHTTTSLSSTLLLPSFACAGVSSALLHHLDGLRTTPFAAIEEVWGLENGFHDGFAAARQHDNLYMSVRKLAGRREPSLGDVRFFLYCVLHVGPGFTGMPASPDAADKMCLHPSLLS
jgi:hypothetical protein